MKHIGIVGIVIAAGACAGCYQERGASDEPLDDRGTETAGEGDIDADKGGTDLADTSASMCTEDVFTGDVRVSTQSALEALAGYRTIEGDLAITGEVTSLEGLACLGHIGGGLTIESTEELITLDGLENLKAAAVVLISNNQSLYSIAQLSGLERVIGGFVSINNNPVLESVEGINLSGLTDTLFVMDNRSLASVALDSAEELTTVMVERNEHLVSISLPNLTSQREPGIISIYTNDALERVDLSRLVSAYVLSVRSNPALTALDVSSLRSVAAKFSVDHSDRLRDMSCLAALAEAGTLEFYNTPLTAIDLSGLETVGGTLNFYNLALEDPVLSLPRLETVDGPVYISFNDTLTAVDLPALVSVSESLSISGNPLLRSLTLPRLTSVTQSVSIVDNPVLTCDADELLGRLDSLTIDICANAPGGGCGPDVCEE